MAGGDATPSPIPVLLREALEEKGVSVRDLGKRWAESSGTKPESKRRLLSRYLAGDVTPTRESIRQVAGQLNIDPEPLVEAVKEAELRLSTPETLGMILEQIVELADAMEQLRDEFRVQAAAPDDHVDQADRATTNLGHLELQVEELLALVRRILGQLDDPEEPAGVEQA